MSTTSDFDRLARAWLDDGPTQLSDRTLDAALEGVHLTRQRRAPRVPWRFPNMPALTRATGIAAAALVAVVGAGGLIYVSSKAPSGPGGQNTTPPATGSPPPVQTAVPTLPPGIPGWTSYTSAVYGFTMGYPSAWLVEAPATAKWPAGRGGGGTSYADAFVSPEGEDQIGFWVWQFPAPAGLDLGSDAALRAALVTLCQSIGNESCEPAFAPKRVCVGASCQPGYVMLAGDAGSEVPHAFFKDPKTGVVTVFEVGREDTFPTAQRYGGTHALLRFLLEHWGA